MKHSEDDFQKMIIYSYEFSNVLVKSHVWPIIHQLDLCVFWTNTVNTAKVLDDAYGIPMDVVIQKVVAILKVLTFADAVCGNQDVNLIV